METLPLTVCCFSKIQIGFTFLVLAHPGSPRRKAVKRVCVCVYGDSVDNTVENFSVFSIISNAPVATSKGVRAVKLCTNEILQFLNGGAC